MKQMEIGTMEGVVLTQESARMAEHAYRYRLIAERKPNADATLWIEVADGEESAVEPVGRDVRRALRYFDRIVSGVATPCNLRDVLVDFLWLDVNA